MALDPGNALLNTGLAGALQTATIAAFGPFPNVASQEYTAKFNDMLATTIINYFKEHAEIKIKTTDEGLQQYLNADTDGPSEDRTLTEVLF